MEIIWIIIIGWLIFEWMKSVEKMKAGDRESSKASERMKEELKKMGVEEKEYKNLEYYGTINLLEEKKEKEFKRRQEKNKKLIEYAEKERIRIERAYKVRPTVAEISKNSFNDVLEIDKDYLDVGIFGNGGEFHFLYVEKEDYKMWRDFIEKGEVPDGMDEADFDEQILDSNILTHFTSIGTAEFGTKNHYIQFEMGEYTEDDDIEFGSIVKDYLGLKGDEDGYVVAQYVHSKKHSLNGSIGVETSVKGPLTKEKITFHETYFKIESKKYNYDVFGPGEYEDWWNSIYKAITPVSDLKDFLPSHVWNKGLEPIIELLKKDSQ